MTAGRPRQFDYDKALDQAMHVFWTKGFEGTSMPDLTNAMNMNRPSIYAAFGNKEELFRKALERYAENSREAFEELLAAPKLSEAIENFMVATATKLGCTESPRGCLAVQSALVCSEEADPAKEAARVRRDDVLGLLEKRFAKGLKDGDLPARTNTKELARFYVTIQQGMSVQSASGASKDELVKIAKRSLLALPQ